MATYWRYRKGRWNATRRVTWVCGEERVLVEEVVDHVRDFVAADAVDYVSLVAGVAGDRDIWAAANQYPVDPSARRLVLVRSAQWVKRWAPLQAWLADVRSMPQTYLLFVSDDEDFPHKEVDGKQELSPPCSWLRDSSSASIVKCGPLAATVPMQHGRPTRPGPSDAVAWLQTHATMEDKTAEYLLTRVGGNLAAARNVAKKAALFDGVVSEQIIDVLCREAPAEDFVMRLITLDKQRAIEAGGFVPPNDYLRVIGEVDNRLQIAGQVYDMLRQRKTMRDAASSGLPPFVLRQVWDSARHYDEQKQKKCRQTLAFVDEQVRAGNRTGALAALVAMW